MKGRLELDCICNTCTLRFLCWDNWLPKKTGEGTNISNFVCPNCESQDLEFDILNVVVKE